MAIQNATPTLWAKMILRAYNTLTVFNGPGVISREYEGTIQSEGDSVKIVSIGDPEVRKYKKDTDITGPDAIVDASQTLIIDQADYLNWAIDGIDLAQVTIDVMEEASRRSAYKLRKEADTFTAKLWEKIDVSTEQKLTEVKRSTFTEGRSAVYDLIVEAGVKLDQTDTPEDGRFVVLNPASVGALQKDLRFTGYGTAPNRSQLEQGLNPASDPFGNANGYVGKVAGFNVFQSNQVQSGTKKYKCIAGHPTAWTFADQILNFETYRPEKRIGATGLKGLHVYGGRVLRPSSLALVPIEDA